jgi:hypothetical protein
MNETLHVPKADKPSSIDSKSTLSDEPAKAHLSISDILSESSHPKNKPSPISQPKSDLDTAISKAKQQNSNFESDSEKDKDIELKKEKDRVAELENKVKLIE